jgi:hypothetical protein
MRKKPIVLFFFLVVVGLIVTIGVYSMLLPKEDTSLTEEQKVMNIAVNYVEENYGTDYSIIGVDIVHYRESSPEGVDYTYPTASFRIPADYQQSGKIVLVMVDPEIGEIKKVFTQPSKSRPPSSPP